jgi:hypothetical protein
MVWTPPNLDKRLAPPRGVLVAVALIFFGSQTVEAIVSAIARLEAIEDRFEPARIAITGTQGHESTLEPPNFVSIVTMDGPSLTTGNLTIFGSR